MATRTANDTSSDLAGFGLAAAVVAVIAWGFGGVLVKLTAMEGLALSFARLWLGFLVMLPVMVVARRRLTWVALRRSALGGLFLGSDVVLFFSSLKLTSVADVTLIGALQPALVLLVAGPWFGERVGIREVGWTIAAVAGTGVVIAGAAGTPAWSPLGDLLAVGALFAFTGYFLVTKRARQSVGTLEYMTGVMLIAALVATPLALASGQDLRPGRAVDWLWLAVFVLVPGAGGHTLMGWAQRYVDVSVTSLVVVGMPVVAAVAALVVLGEPLTVPQVLGGLLVLVSISAILRRPTASS
jgi:drug/metabolite transporter (DMT)-like permease